VARFVLLARRSVHVKRPCLQELISLREDILRAEEAHESSIAGVDPDRRASARNLLHYLAFRRHDVRPLQRQLASFGVSSLGRLEPHVLSTIDAVLRILNREIESDPESAPGGDFDWGDRVLREQTERLLGPPASGRSVRIMVTMPNEAADDYRLIHELIAAGMNCLRINCAHGDRSQWLRMVEHVRRAETSLKTSCKVLIDLAGAKLRTVPMEPVECVVKVRPARDVFGRVTAPARVWLTPRSAPAPPPAVGAATLPVGQRWFRGLREGQTLVFRDARDARRSLRVTAVELGGAWAELCQTAYFVPGLVVRRVGQADARGERETRVGELPRREATMHLQIGDALVLTREMRPGHAARLDPSGRVLMPATIGCTLPRVFDDVRAGESIWFDDGRLGGTIERVSRSHLYVRITHAPPEGGRLGADKGINLPDSTLRVPPLTDKDLTDLPFIVQHADIVGLSFACSGDDVDALHRQIAQVGPRRPAIMLKVETRRGFEHLPEMLIAAMKMPTCGVMIARGDLAVECGFERLAEVQEEMLWICEAAHVPVVWATQVLEGLAKQGMPSRAEITDAAMGHRAECVMFVMLNKGPHIISAVRTLDDILQRMDAHQFKKRSMMRELRLAHAL
jgi:pyruvate kinase